jgi:uncharacterized protein YdaU (DUF1376 family)
MSSKPDSYMPFYWKDFWEAVKGWPDCAIVGYQMALTYYWFHNHCEGLKDDEQTLRRICSREKDEWNSCRELIFDNDKFFRLDVNGLWQQRRAKELWDISNARYEAAVRRARDGAAKRWNK